MESLKIPPFLQSGHRVALCPTARFVTPDEVAPVAKLFSQAGLELVVPDGAFAQYNQFGGTDDERASLFQKCLDDNDIQAILVARGGYGSVRMIDKIGWARFAQKPKWICGFSDVTVLHSHINRNMGVATLHCDMVPQLKDKDFTHPSVFSLMQALLGNAQEINAPSSKLNLLGSVRAPLVGGNLSMLYSLLGSDSDIDTEGRILFIEDLDEYLYHIDRMMMNLKRNGKLRALAGLVVGGLTQMHDNAIPFGKSAEEIIQEHLRELGIPVAFHVDAGHVNPSIALILGATHELVVDDSGTRLTPIIKFNDQK